MPSLCNLLHLSTRPSRPCFFFPRNLFSETRNHKKRGRCHIITPCIKLRRATVKTLFCLRFKGSSSFVSWIANFFIRIIFVESSQNFIIYFYICNPRQSEQSFLIEKWKYYFFFINLLLRKRSLEIFKFSVPVDRHLIVPFRRCLFPEVPDTCNIRLTDVGYFIESDKYAWFLLI